MQVNIFYPLFFCSFTLLHLSNFLLSFNFGSQVAQAGFQFHVTGLDFPWTADAPAFSSQVLVWVTTSCSISVFGLFFFMFLFLIAFPQVVLLSFLGFEMVWRSLCLGQEDLLIGLLASSYRKLTQKTSHMLLGDIEEQNSEQVSRPVLVGWVPLSSHYSC